MVVAVVGSVAVAAELLVDLAAAAEAEAVVAAAVVDVAAEGP